MSKGRQTKENRDYNFSKRTGTKKRQVKKPIKKLTKNEIALRIKNELKEKRDEPCPICMENLGKTNVCTTKCGHQFCLECMLKHSKKNKNCPMCRADMPGADYLVHEEYEEYEEYDPWYRTISGTWIPHPYSDLVQN